MKKILSIFFLIILSHLIVAQTAEGGGAYIQASGKLINCVITKNYAINGFGVSGTVGGIVTNCTITNNYYLNQAIINSGDMLLSDGSVYSPSYDTNGNIIFPLPLNVQAVCFWSNGNNDFLNAKAWFIAVDETTLMWTPVVNNNQVNITNLFDYGNPVGAIADQDGAGNTAKIISDSHFLGSLNSTNCAAYYCNQYGGTPGIWYLPSLGQLQQLYNSLTTTNKVLNALVKTPISITRYWSSTEVTDWGAWCYDFTYNGVVWSPQNQISKGNPLKVRAIRSLQQSN